MKFDKGKIWRRWWSWRKTKRAFYCWKRWRENL
nr:MAG TPA: hypothetical protein [Caudoviricetes sp.]